MAGARDLKEEPSLLSVHSHGDDTGRRTCTDMGMQQTMSLSGPLAVSALLLLTSSMLSILPIGAHMSDEPLYLRLQWEYMSDTRVHRLLFVRLANEAEKDPRGFAQ